MSESSSTSKPPTSTIEIQSTATPAVVTTQDDTPLAQFLAEPPTSPLPALPSPLPATIPTEPKAMTVAKAKQQTPQKPIKKDPRYTRSESPSPPSPPPKPFPSYYVTTPKKSKKHSSSHISPNSIVLPYRKRAGDHLPSSSPTAKRQAIRESTPTPAPKAPRARNDHWSPSSSRASSPVRSAAYVVPIPAAKWYSHLKTSRSASSAETRPRLHVATSSSSTTTTKKEKQRAPKVSVIVGKVDVKEEKQVCYNCGKKGHWFMDCLFGCGKCEGVGHRTIDCQVVKMHTGQVVKEETVGA